MRVFHPPYLISSHSYYLYIQRKILGLFLENLCMFFFWILIENCWNLYRKTSERLLKTAFYVSRTTTWGIWFFEHFVFSFSHFRNLIKKALEGFAISLRGLLKLQFTCPEEHIKDKMVHVRKNFTIFSPRNSSWAEMFWTFGKNKSNSVVTIALYVSRGHFVERFLRTFYFAITFRHWTKSFWTLDGKCFHRDSETAFYMSEQRFLENFPQRTVFDTYGFWALIKNCSNFFRKEGSIKRHYVCPGQQFEGNGLLKKFFSFYHLRTFIEETSHDLQKFEQGCQSCIPNVRRNTLQAKGFFWRKVIIFWFINGR